MKKNFTLIFIGFLLSMSTIYAQNYKTGVGGRVGFFSGFTGKYFLNDRNALEGLMAFRWSGFLITGLYEWQKQIDNVENLDWFIGLGGHAGIWNKGYYYDHHYYADGGCVGGDFIIGMEYTFKTAPLTLGMDLKPTFNVIGDNHWWGNGFGISVRYILK